MTGPVQEALVRTHPKHAIIVSPDSDKDSSDEVLGKVREVPDAKNNGIQVEGVRRAKNQKVVLSCASKKGTKT